MINRIIKKVGGFVEYHMSGGVGTDLVIVPHEHGMETRPVTHYTQDTSKLVRRGTDNLNLGENYFPENIIDQLKSQNR